MTFIMFSTVLEIRKIWIYRNEINDQKKDHSSVDKWSFFYVLNLVYSTINVIGKVYFTPTGLPLCFPGVISGNNLTTLTASFSRRA